MFTILLCLLSLFLTIVFIVEYWGAKVYLTLTKKERFAREQLPASMGIVMSFFSIFPGLNVLFLVVLSGFLICHCIPNLDDLFTTLVLKFFKKGAK